MYRVLSISLTLLLSKDASNPITLLGIYMAWGGLNGGEILIQQARTCMTFYILHFTHIALPSSSRVSLMGCLLIKTKYVNDLEKFYISALFEDKIMNIEILI